MAFATDYDCWHETAGDISIGEILRILGQSTKTARKIIREAVQDLPQERSCPCANAVERALLTSKKLIPEKTKKDLEPIIGKYIK
jgi:5'-methylthioadenosine phosphorylase